MNFYGTHEHVQHCPPAVLEELAHSERYYGIRLPRKVLNSAHGLCVPIEYNQRYAEALKRVDRNQAR